MTSTSKQKVAVGHYLYEFRLATPFLAPLKYNRTATASTKIAKTLYSAFRKDIAPSAMCFAIFDIFSFPLLWNMYTRACSRYLSTNRINRMLSLGIRQQIPRIIT